MPLMTDSQYLYVLSQKHYELLNEVRKMDLETSTALRTLTEDVAKLHRGIHALSTWIGPGSTKKMEDAMYGSDRHQLLLEAARECLTPDQYQQFLNMLGTDSDTSNRLYNCIVKRVP